MSKISNIGMLAAVAFGAALALSSQAGEVQGPSSVSESAPDKTGKKAKGAAGVPTDPSKGPASVSESAPQKTGKEPAAPGTSSLEALKYPAAMAAVAINKAFRGFKPPRGM